jgi:hypothetical protein
MKILRFLITSSASGVVGPLAPSAINLTLEWILSTLSL